MVSGVFSFSDSPDTQTYNVKSFLQEAFFYFNDHACDLSILNLKAFVKMFCFTQRLM